MSHRQTGRIPQKAVKTFSKISSELFKKGVQNFSIFFRTLNVPRMYFRMEEESQTDWQNSSTCMIILQQFRVEFEPATHLVSIEKSRYKRYRAQDKGK